MHNGIAGSTPYRYRYGVPSPAVPRCGVLERKPWTTSSITVRRYLSSLLPGGHDAALASAVPSTPRSWRASLLDSVRHAHQRLKNQQRGGGWMIIAEEGCSLGVGRVWRGEKESMAVSNSRRGEGHERFPYSRTEATRNSRSGRSAYSMALYCVLGLLLVLQRRSSTAR